MNRSAVVEQCLYLSFAVALVATLGSLYFSEVVGYYPCEYCWYQRIFMYPLVIILGIAAVRKDHLPSIYVMPLAAIGGCLSLYHYLTHETSIFGQDAGNACGLVPCNMEYINWFGFITIPFLAFIAFVLIFTLQWIVWRNTRS